jgi:hypothetical protein
MIRTGVHSSCQSPRRKPVAIESRIRELGNRHDRLDQVISEEARRPSSDTLRLAALKREKLRLKEEIEGLKGRPH